MEKRIISTGLLEEDARIEGSLRPISLDDYIGQDKIKDNINLEEAFDDWYLDKCRGFHDNVFFETPRQNFFESFFYNTPHEIEEFTENETIISYIKSHIINMRLKIQQEKNK